MSELFYCPFKCGRSGYPRPKWKTRAGFDRHLANCENRPEAVAARVAASKTATEAYERVKDHALATCPHKKGDWISYVFTAVIKPTHETNRWGRRVHVRYEEERKIYGRHMPVETVAFDGAILINGHVRLRDIYPTLAEAQAVAKAAQEAYDQHVAESRRCR